MLLSQAKAREAEGLAALHTNMTALHQRAAAITAQYLQEHPPRSPRLGGGGDSSEGTLHFEASNDARV